MCRKRDLHARWSGRAPRSGGVLSRSDSIHHIGSAIEIPMMIKAIEIQNRLMQMYAFVVRTENCISHSSHTNFVFLPEAHKSGRTTPNNKTESTLSFLLYSSLQAPTPPHRLHLTLSVLILLPKSAICRVPLLPG